MIHFDRRVNIQLKEVTTRWNSLFAVHMKMNLFEKQNIYNMIDIHRKKIVVEYMKKFSVTFVSLLHIS